MSADYRNPLKVIEQPAEVSRQILKLKAEGKSIGFVPTMGALHQGHLRLLEYAMAENNVSLASIFINPLQFNNSQDLDRYPRMVEQDLDMLEKSGCDLVLLPNTESMYQNPTRITLDFGTLSSGMEEKFRPGHFTGVGVIVAKLFHLTWPDRAYFGLKDLQQCAVVKTLVSDLGFPVELRFIETMRETDGLAMSSRNQRLSSSGRKMAANLYQTLTEIRNALKEKTFAFARNKGIENLANLGINKVEYLEMVDFETMEPVLEPNSAQKTAICIAAWVDDVRLIDNVFV